MKIITIAGILMLTAMASLAVHAGELRVGDGQINGKLIEPFKFIWQQCSLSEDQWVDAGEVSEQWTIIGEHTARVRRQVENAQGIRQQTDTFYDRSSLAPLMIESQVTDAQGQQLGAARRHLNAKGYQGEVTRGADTQAVSGAISSSMLEGSALGLPLATLNYQDQPLTFLASMMAFDATYEVTATWAGKEATLFNEQRVELWMVDLHWKHREIGDIYPPGPDASGGRFWIAHNPPEGFPYVPRYKTDTYAVEFQPITCPGADQ